MKYNITGIKKSQYSKFFTEDIAKILREEKRKEALARSIKRENDIERSILRKRGENGLIHYSEKKFKKPLSREWWSARIVEQGRITDVTIKNFKPKPNVKRLNKTEYVVIESGEVKDYRKKGEEEMRNRRSLQVIFRQLRQTINANFDMEDKNQLAITLTYRPNEDGTPMTDAGRVYTDFKKFMMRLRYAYPEYKFEYIVIVEPQGWGAWHCHVLLKSDKELVADYKTRRAIYDIWGMGRTSTQQLSSTDHYGAYFQAYLTNLEITPENQDKLHIKSDDIEEIKGQDGKTKRIIKGMRLKFYPEYMQIWRHSRGIKKAVNYDIEIGEELRLEQISGLGKKTYQSEHTIEAKNRDLLVINQQFKRK